MKTERHQVEFCVVGGGMAGLCAAVAAARKGTKTLLMHDRPVLGGNASSEIRMWICGARGKNMRETGIIEEIQLDNRRLNPCSSYAVWDAILYGKAAFQENLTLLLNCSCCEAAMDGTKINAVTGWQITTETRHVVEAACFADCSGDSILAPLSGADFRIGREAMSEFEEDIAPDIADDLTMGMSCLLQARETDRPQPFIPPDWAYKYPTDDFIPNRPHDLETNFWWIEIGGEADSVHDAEKNRDELLRIAYGIWDHIKNRGDHGAENWMLEWVGFLPGKRESRRYIGDHILTQSDVRSGGCFDDIVAYGGWPMDDHHPAGFRHPGEPTVFHPAPSPYGIPYRCLYSRNIDNLLFAGRNISATHAAMSSTRVMATCAILGQAIGTAAALVVCNGLRPADVGTEKIRELQQMLMYDDCYLPGKTRTIGEIMANAGLTASEGDPEALRSGVDRTVGHTDNAWRTRSGGDLIIDFDVPRRIRKIRLVFDSDLSRKVLNMPAMRPLDYKAPGMPPTLVRDFRVEGRLSNGAQKEIARVVDNHQRLVFVDVDGEPVKSVRIIIERSWGGDYTGMFSVDIE